MAFADHYLARHAVTDKINTPPAKDLRQIIVIPCYDEPALVQSLESLWLCERPSCAVEVIIVINSADNTPDEILAGNMETLQKARQWINNHHEPGFMFHIVHEPSMPARYAGPGLARKTGMDQAVLRFNMTDHSHGIIISFDADTTCRPDYLKEIESCFTRDQNITGCTVCFEHPVEGKQYADTVYRAIAEYELHLRYYIEAIRHTGFPHACHTIGSAFCVSASAYVSQGGMNKRKAGEDFYFLQKIIPSGRFAEINTTCVYPSPRPSGRVPFGTGAVVKKYAEGRIKRIDTYHPDAFYGLTVLFSNPSAWFRMKPPEIEKAFNELPETIRDFAGHEFRAKITEINNNCSGPASFTKRFWHWFNMFRIMKYLNFVHQKHFTKIPVGEAAAMFLERKRYTSVREASVIELLHFFRRLQREKS
jgi:hypothetical protein